MRYRSRNIPRDSAGRAQYIETEAATLVTRFQDPELASPPEITDATLSDQAMIALLTERFRAALAAALTLSELCQTEGQPRRGEQLANVATRARRALRELDAGAEGAFGPLLPSARSRNHEAEQQAEPD